jgi:hypothetical protein
MKLTIATLILLAVGVGVAAQSPPTLRIVTEVPGLPSDLFYGNIKVKPLRVRPGTNPPQLITIDDNDFFTQYQYIDFLNRMPDQSGFQFWLGQITSCGNNSSCIEVMRINVSGSFFLSIEFKETGYLAVRTYKTAFGNHKSSVSTLGGGSPHTIVAPIINFAEFQADIKQLAQNVVVLQPGWEQVLENNKVAYFNAFVQRTSFVTEYPTNMTPAEFVDKLNLNGGNPLSTSERNQLVNDLTGGQKTRAQILRAVAEDQDLFNAEFNRAFVLMQYFGYLRRDPNSGQDTDHTGYEFWLNKLNQFNGNFIQAEMVKAFISSIEYRARF